MAEKYLSKVKAGDDDLTVKDKSAREEISVMTSPFTGRDLTEVFADEITEYDNEWAWIKARINDGNFEGMVHGDYMPMVFNDEWNEMQINIDPYYGPSTNYQYFNKHHIDFISRDLYGGDYYVWNNSGHNNGSSSARSPYANSDIYRTLNNELYEDLPDEVKALVSEKRVYAETRYSSSGNLEDSNGYNLVNLGKLWLPSEFEVCGETIWATPGYDTCGAIQYPIFAHNYETRCKRFGPSGDPTCWWLRSVVSGSSYRVCFVDFYGVVYWGLADDDYGVPLCFRISAD